MSRNNKALAVVAGFTCLFLSLASNAGKPGDGASGPQDVNVVNTPTVNIGSGGPIGVDVLSLPSQPLTVAFEAPKFFAELGSIPASSGNGNLTFTEYTPAPGKRVVIKSIRVSAQKTLSGVTISYAGGWQRVPVHTLSPTTTEMYETTMALPEGPFSISMSLQSGWSSDTAVSLLVTFYEVPAN